MGKSQQFALVYPKRISKSLQQKIIPINYDFRSSQTPFGIEKIYHSTTSLCFCFHTYVTSLAWPVSGQG